VHVCDFVGGILSVPALKMPPLKVPPIAAYGYIYIYKCSILQFLHPAIKNFVCTFKARHFGRQGFLYYSYRAFSAQKLCTFGGGILSACGAQNAAQTVSRGGGAIALIVPMDPPP